MASPALGADKDGTFVGVGGDASCGKWHEAARSNRYQRSVYASWLNGYVSGVNRIAPGVGVMVDGDQIKAYVDRYCENNPLHI
jgi:hypothetical protein